MIMQMDMRMVESDSQITGLMDNLSEYAHAGTLLAGRLETLLIQEQSALTSRKVDLVESVLSDKQDLLRELDTVEKNVNEIFSYLNVIARQWKETARGYIRLHYPQVNSKIEKFIEGINTCKRKGMENDGLLNVQMLQISATIDMLSPGGVRTSKATYSKESNFSRGPVSTSQWVA